jgi:hypothetical protein
MAPAFVLSGCGSNPNQDPAVVAQTQEIEKLRQENQSLEPARAQNEEVQRLKKENQDLPKLRSQYQEAGRLKKENEQLRQQIAKISPAALTNSASAGQSAATQSSTDAAKEKSKVEEFALNEGDEIMIDPKLLKQIAPEVDWDKLDRKAPLGVRALLEKDGIQLTNALQLHEYGITNFVIRRAPPPPPPQTPDKPN